MPGFFVISTLKVSPNVFLSSVPMLNLQTFVVLAIVLLSVSSIPLLPWRTNGTSVKVSIFIKISVFDLFGMFFELPEVKPCIISV